VLDIFKAKRKWEPYVHMVRADGVKRKASLCGIARLSERNRVDDSAAPLCPHCENRFERIVERHNAKERAAAGIGVLELAEQGDTFSQRLERQSGRGHTDEEIAALASGQAFIYRFGEKEDRCRLNAVERAEIELAKDRGYLVTRSRRGNPLNIWFYLCESRDWPYVFAQTRRNQAVLEMDLIAQSHSMSEHGAMMVAETFLKFEARGSEFYWGGTFSRHENIKIEAIDLAASLLVKIALTESVVRVFGPEREGDIDPS
jgi:hypothetical protein